MKQYITSTIQADEKTNLVYTLWIPRISWTSIKFHYFRGHTAVISTNFWKKLLALQWMSNFFVELKKVFQQQQQE